MKTCETDTLLSFILPVYNVEAYLRECVDSILEQATEECEIILVNDGSKDSSGDICTQYAESNPLVKLVNKENGGLSSARNAGLDIAKGKYVSFIDSDDKIFSESIAAILQWIKSRGADLCFLPAVKLYPDGAQTDLGESIDGSQLCSKIREDAIKYLASRPKYPGSAWAKLYRRDFLINNQLHFPYDRRYSEDLGFIRDCLLYAQSFDALDIPYYQYRQSRQGSITNKITSKNFYDLLLFITESCEKLTLNKIPKDPVRRDIMSFVAYEYYVLLYLYARIPDEAKSDALLRLEEYKWVLKYGNRTRGKLLSLTSNLFGVRFTSTLMKRYRMAIEK